MKGAVLYGPGDIRFEDPEMPKIIEPTDAVLPHRGDLRVRSRPVAAPGLAADRRSHADGHEHRGFVEEEGSAVKSVKPGNSWSVRSRRPTTPVPIAGTVAGPRVSTVSSC